MLKLATAEITDSTSDSSLHPERRRIERIPVNAQATIWTRGDLQLNVSKNLHLIDYSDNGLGAICDAAIDPGSELAIALPWGGGRLEEGRVVRCQP